MKVKGENTFNSNGQFGILTNSLANTFVEINVENGSTLETCGNGDYDIYGYVGEGGALTFLGDGYTCDQDEVVFFDGDGTVVKPDCQACPP